MAAESKRNGEKPESQLSVLLYHYVGPRGNALPSLTISPEVFNQQMRFLSQNGYRVVSETDVIELYEKAVALPPKPVLITFDDAYADLVQYAFPVLRRYGFSAVVFAVTELLGKTNEWDAGRAPITALMNAEQVAKWSKLGVTFGSHSQTHADLSLESGSRPEAEIVTSAETLTKITGRQCQSFCFPWGRFNEDALALVKKRYRLAFGTVNGMNSREQDRYQIRRMMVRPGDSMLGFRLKLLFGTNPLLSARAWIAGVRNTLLGRS